MMKVVLVFMGAVFSLSSVAGCDFIQGRYIDELKDLGNVKEIYVNVSNSRKWAMNSLRIIKSGSENIKDKFKRKFKSTIDVVYDFGRCSYKANIRQSGDWRDHIELSDGGRIRQSIDVKLKEGNIAGIVKFKLLLPSTRKGEEEVYATVLLRELGYLAPRTVLIDAEVNGNKEKYLLQESTRKEMLEYNNRREGPVFEGDESLLWGYGKFPLFSLEKISLARQENIKWALKGKTSLEISLIALGRMQSTYLDYVLNQFPEGYISAGSIDWRLLNLGKKPIRSPYLYEILLLSMNGDHALRPHNRKYYYNTIDDIFEPIYYDGNITSNSDVRFEFTEKEHLSRFMNKLEASDLERLNSDLEKVKAENALGPGFGEFVKNTRTNLETVMSVLRANGGWSNNYTYPVNRISDYSSLLFKSLPSSRSVFVGEVHDEVIDVESCIFDGCSSEEISYEDIAKIMARRGDPGLFVLSYNKKIDDTESVTVLDGIMIEHSSGATVERADGVLLLKQSDPNDWFLIRDSIISNITIRFIGKGEEVNKSGQRFNLRGITGCLTIYNSTIKDSSIYAIGGSCEDSINIVSSKGTIDRISVVDSSSDAIDSDFSSLDVQEITVENSGNDCVDFSSGLYNINNMNVVNCGDKGISVGESSSVVVENAFINSRKIGVSSKDSSASQIMYAEITAPVCSESYNKKQEFGGASLVLEQVVCSNDNYYADESSLIAF